VISIIGSGTLTPRSDALLDLVVDLANRDDLEASGRDDASPLTAARDLLYGLDYAVDQLDALDLATLRWMRGELRRLFIQPDFDDVARLITLFLERSDARPVLVTDDDGQAELSMTSGNTSVSDAVMADAAVALAALVSRGGVRRLGVCAAEGCGRAFYDRSQAGNRRYCDPQTCGNRVNFAAYRRRRTR
jgi:predicted RNA-binding Zn ribbon-like protein